MLEMLADYDIHPKAVLWVQGEAEGYEDSAGTYLERFAALVRAVREALSQPGCRSSPFSSTAAPRRRTSARPPVGHHARSAAPGRPHTSGGVCPSADLALYDFIHNAAEGNLVVGERCARAAFGPKAGGTSTGWPRAGIRGTDRARHGDGSFARIRNWLNAYEVPAPLLPFDAEGRRRPRAIPRPMRRAGTPDHRL